MTEATPNDRADTQRRPPPAERRTRALDAFIDLTLEHGRTPAQTQRAWNRTLDQIVPPAERRSSTG